MSNPEWIKCLVCKTSRPINDGLTFQDGVARKGDKCPYCGEVGLIRDKRAEARAKTRAEEAEAEEAKKAELDKFMYPVPAHVFREGLGCPNCSGHEGIMEAIIYPEAQGWSNSVLVTCTCFYTYTWPCVDIRTLDHPGEEKPLSPRDEETRLRKMRDDQLEEAFNGA